MSIWQQRWVQKEPFCKGLMWANTKQSYGWVSIVLHWAIALAIIGLFASGLYMTSLDYYHPWYQPLPHYHQSFGILLGVLLVFRLIWRYAQPRPISLVGGWQGLVAHAMHWLLYLGPLTLVLSGYLISSAENEPVPLFDWLLLPDLPFSIKNQADNAGAFHYYASIALLAAAALHALAALKHHFVNKDAVLTRMLIRRVKP